MKTIGLSDLDLEAVGINVHLAGTVWEDTEKGEHYLIPLSDDFEPNFDNLAVMLLDSNETVRMVNQAWLLEARRNPGHKGHLTKIALIRMRKAVEPKLMWKVFRRDAFTCVYCGQSEGPMTYDHFIPQSQGGPTNEENGRTCCKPCNKSKGDMQPGEWLSSPALVQRREWLRKYRERENRKHGR